MKFLRKHILKTGFVVLVCFGLFLTFCKPMMASQPAYSFADWLQTYAKVKLTPQITKELNGLYQSNSDINTIFKKAEKILSKNGGNSELPHSMSPEAIHHILLMKWNLYMAGRGMQAISTKTNISKEALPSTVKPLVAGGLHKLLMGDGGTDAFKEFSKSTSPFLLGNRIIPLVDAISIGAP